jgi:hypothetical protein
MTDYSTASIVARLACWGMLGVLLFLAGGPELLLVGTMCVMFGVVVRR